MKSLLALVVFLVGFITMPGDNYFGDPFASRMEARALVLHHTLSVDPGIASHFGVQGQYFVQDEDGQWYSKYGLATGLVAAVPMFAEYLITGEAPPGTRPIRYVLQGTFYTLIAVGIAILLYDICGYYVDNVTARVVFVLLSCYSTYLWYYLRSGTTESTQLFFFLIFFWSLLHFKRSEIPIGERPLTDLTAGWIALGVLTQSRFTYLLYLPVVGAYIAYLFWREKLPKALWGDKAARAIILPITLIVIALGLVFKIKFGSPFLTGYHQWWDGDRPHTVWQVLYDFLINPQWSFFFNFMPLALALFGWRRFMHEHLAEAALVLYFLLMTFIIIEPLPFWRGEWCYGPRYFIFILPLASLPALYPLHWAIQNWRRPLPASILAVILAAGTLMMYAQWQVIKVDFSFRYDVHPNAKGRIFPDSGGIKTWHYFATTPYSKIAWDVTHAQHHWDTLPFFAEVQKNATPENLARWEERMDAKVRQSNLFWFP